LPVLPRAWAWDGPALLPVCVNITGYGVSMLKLLADAHPDMVAKLSYQYRMNGDICQLSNDLVYKGALKCANDCVRNQALDLPGFPENVEESWLRAALDPSMPVVFVNTDQNEGAIFKPLVRLIVDGLVACGVQADIIGIICPFRAQVSKSSTFRFNYRSQVSYDNTVAG
jgi:DNA replication ATP-dependent helicase Dna2